MDPMTAFGIGNTAMQLLGSGQGNKNLFRQAQAERDYNIQKEFAQMGIQWRVQDAINAGLHPLYALGASTPGFSPSAHIGSSSPDIGPALASMGQNIGRAIQANADPNIKAMQETQTQIANEQLRGLRLRNDEIEFGPMAALIGSPGDPPGISTSPVADPAGQVRPSAGFNAFTYKPTEVGSASGDDPSLAAGPPIPHWQTVMLESTTARGPFRMDLPNKEVSEQWEALGESATLWLMTAQRNIRRFGPEWWSLFKENYPEKAALIENAWRLRHQGSREFMGDSNMPPSPESLNRGSRPSTMDQLHGR